MTQYMLLFSLGPVQPFIAQARKTRDLWLGSFLLSALMQVSMEGIETKLVFPNKPFIDKNKEIPDLPNKYIAIFDTPDDAVDAAVSSERKIKQFWQDICNDVWDFVLEKPAHSIKATRDLWNEQTNAEHVFEIFWVIVAKNDKQYKEWLKETQLTFDSRKHLRNFPQQEESGEKSTISGLRSALRGSGEQREDVRKFWSRVATRQSPRDISPDGAERLDAIDTVKRFAFCSRSLTQKLGRTKLDAGFPSTSSIATATFIERLIAASEDPALSSAIAEWLARAKELNEVMPASIPLLSTQARSYPLRARILELDGDCLFPETFNANRLKKEFRFDDERKAAKLARSGPEALAKLFRATDTLIPPIARPTPYYAMIQMDGDKMGSLINGVQDKDEHEKISRALSDFSRMHVPAIVEENYPGRLIYAGGDDVFALAPLARDSIQPEQVQENQTPPVKTALDLVDQLQQRYRQVVQAKVKDTKASENGEVAQPPSRKELVTASAGIAIAHHYTSLSYVRRMSKEAEQLAKNHYGRNALVVTVLRRSGEQTRVGCHWRYPDINDEEAQPVPLFLFFYNLFKEDILSPKSVFSLLEEAPTLVGLKRDAQQSEVKRILRRQRNPALEDHLPDDVIHRKAEQLVKLAQAMDEAKHPILKEKQGLAVELHSDSRRYGLVEVLGWLLVMLFLTRKEQE